MIHANRLVWRETDMGPEPVLTIRVEGIDDVYRLAHHLRRGQCEFAEIGYRVETGIARKLGRKRWQSLLGYFHGRRAAA